MNTGSKKRITLIGMIDVAKLRRPVFEIRRLRLFVGPHERKLEVAIKRDFNIYLSGWKFSNYKNILNVHLPLSVDIDHIPFYLMVFIMNAAMMVSNA